MDAELSQKLAGLTDVAMRAAMAQVKYWIPFELAWEGAIILAAIIGTCFVVKRWEWISDEDTCPLFILGLSILWGWALLAGGIGLPNTLSAIWNPEYWAIKELIPHG